MTVLDIFPFLVCSTSPLATIPEENIMTALHLFLYRLQFFSLRNNTQWKKTLPPLISFVYGTFPSCNNTQGKHHDGTAPFPLPPKIFSLAQQHPMKKQDCPLQSLLSTVLSPLLQWNEKKNLLLARHGPSHNGRPHQYHLPFSRRPWRPGGVRHQQQRHTAINQGTISVIMLQSRLLSRPLSRRAAKPSIYHNAFSLKQGRRM